MSTAGGSDVVLVKAATPSPSPQMKAATPSPSPLAKIDVDYMGSRYEMHASLSEEERRFYLKMYPNVDIINQRRVHCTVCRQHLGTALAAENNIKMHPILRVTHCVKCHDFYNSGEFSKGEDGSELYCRWCGQGGEVYCCSTCPYVFCKSCIVKNLSRGVIVDIEQNEHWNCFNCTSKILWPLRAQHWALVNYIQSTKKALQSMQMSELEARRHMLKDNTSCCRLAKSKATSLSDSMESLESNTSKRSQGSSANSAKRTLVSKPSPGPSTKRPKSSNDEVVCTPDLLSMLEPDCQLSMLPKPSGRQPGPASSITTTPRIVTVQQNYTGPSPSNTSNGSGPSTSMVAPRASLPPPLVLSGSGIRYRQSSPVSVTSVRRTVVPNVVRNSGPVFHTINGFRVDLNSAAQQDSYRLPNGRLIQVKRQVPLANPPTGAPTTPTTPIVIPPLNPGVVIRPRGPPPGGRPPMQGQAFGNNMGVYNPQTNQQQRAPQIVRVNQNQAATPAPAQQVPAPNSNGSGGGGQTLMITPVPGPPKTQSLVRQNFANTTLGQARSQLQEQIFSAMDICTHLTGKVVSLTHSNAYNQVRNHLDLKELYIHMSYLMTYAIGRFKHLQEKCLVDMREMGFKNDANSLENGQLAAAVDYVCYGQLDDVDLFNTGCNSFHNQVYEYRKSLHANLKEGEDCEPLPPLMPLGVRAEGDPIDEEEPPELQPEQKQDAQEEEVEANDFDYDETEDLDDDLDDDDLDNEECGELGTEESMNRNEQAHAYDRKLTRLLREYPSLWCTRHPDYGKKEVTLKQWRVIATHFPRGDDIKLRWKNVRKRYVRIERRLKQGKRFKGYFDKATNYLANRDRPRSEWLAVDCGEDDGDGFERKQLDVIENTMEHREQKPAPPPPPPSKPKPRFPMRPLEVRAIDQRIITFAKSHPVLWRKSTDPEFNSIDEQTRKSLWQNFWKSAPKKQASDDEDNEIEIVEPKTDTITIDSDNDDDTPSTSTQQNAMLKIVSVTSAAPKKELMENQTEIDVAAFSSTILASLLEVDIQEGSGDPKSISPGQKKQPRKKTTNKPNPALLQLERRRMEELKRSDVKLKKKCVVKLRRAEEDFEVARQWVERNKKRNQEEQPLSSDAQEDAATPSDKVTDTAKASASAPAEAPSEKDVEELAKNSPPKDDQQPMEIDVQLISSAPKDQEKEDTNKDKESADSEQKESDKQTPPEAKDKVTFKEKIGNLLKAAIKAKITRKSQTEEDEKPNEKSKTEEKQNKETIEITADQGKDTEEVAKQKEAHLKKVSEKDSSDEKKKESETQSEEEAENKEIEKNEKDDIVSEEQKPVEKENSLQSETTSETVSVTEEIIEEETEKVLDQDSSKEKDHNQSEKESTMGDEKESLPEKVSDHSDEKDDEEAPTETVSDEVSTEPAPPSDEVSAKPAHHSEAEADHSQDADKEVVPEECILQIEELAEQYTVADLDEAMVTATDNGEPSAAELVESMDVIELDEPPKELLEVIAMEGIELSCATEELMKALVSSPSALTSETDLDADNLIETLPMETTEPPEILLKDEDENGETEKSEAAMINSGENGEAAQGEASGSSAPEEVPVAGQIQG